VPFTVLAQQRSELEQKKKKLLREIALTSKLLKETTSSKEAALDRYVTLQKQIKKREKLISTLKREINFVNASIERTTDVVKALNEDIHRLETEYAQLIRTAYRQKLTSSPILFVLSAESFNEGFKRWQYVKQYDAYRNKQAQLINETKAKLAEKIRSQETRRKEKNKLLKDQQGQKTLLATELDTRNNMYRSLKKDESRLKSDLKEFNKLKERLESAIKDVIALETRKDKATDPTSNSIKTKTHAISFEKMTTDFMNSRGTLPWPVQNGVITRHFGKQAHPTLRKIEITNNGVDLRTEKNAPVRAIFNGEVAGIEFIPGYSNTVILKHGDYYTVYSNLEDVTVEKGEFVSGMQQLGTVNMNRKTQSSELHFEVWRQKTRLNPIDWVRK